MRTLCLHASELAALVGRHRYQPRDEALLKLMRRVDARGCAAFMERRGLADPDAGRALYERLASDDASVSRAVQGALETSSTAATGAAASAAAEQALEAVQGSAGAAGLGAAELEKVKDHCRSMVYTTYGTHREAAVTDGVRSEQQDTSIVKDDVYRKRMAFELPEHGGDGVRVFVGGKCDGICEGPGGEKYLLEVKNRVNRLFRSVPEYERVQVMAYMFITGLQTCMLVEQRGAEKATHTVDFDASYWDGVQALLRQSVVEVFDGLAAGSQSP